MSQAYICSDCGNESLKWSGVCPSCGSWNSLKEYKVSDGVKDKKVSEAEIFNLSDIKKENITRIKTGIFEMDRVLGGGIVPESVILIGGDPGIGKSTLISQVLGKLNNAYYVSGEESLIQIKIRFDRLNIKKDINVISETNVDSIIKTLGKKKPDLVIIDSIQTMYTSQFPSTPGSMVQIRETALKLQQYAKSKGVALIVIGHVTKEGAVAGPKIIEHLVDVVLYLEGEKYHSNRILRSVKNRFGAVDEIGIFNMQETGLEEVKNAASLFLEENIKDVAGTVVGMTIEGNRPMLFEAQSLLVKSDYGFARRTASGFDLNRVNLLVAIITKRLKLPLFKYDIYVNIVGGLKIKDPGMDLAVCLSIISAYYNKPISKNACFWGEVGLLGEIRKVKFDQKRLKEAQRIGYNYKKADNIEKLINNLFKV